MAVPRAVNTMLMGLNVHQLMMILCKQTARVELLPFEWVSHLLRCHLALEVAVAVGKAEEESS